MQNNTPPPGNWRKEHDEYLSELFRKGPTRGGLDPVNINRGILKTLLFLIFSWDVTQLASQSCIGGKPDSGEYQGDLQDYAREVSTSGCLRGLFYLL